MTRSSTTKNWIEWSAVAPCAEHRDGLLRLAVAPESAPAAGAELRRHLVTCRSCAAFLDQLRQQRHLVRDPAAWGEPGQALRDPLKTTEFSDWLEAELRVRTERELADVLARLAASVLYADAGVRWMTSLAGDGWGARTRNHLARQFESLVKVRARAGESDEPRGRDATGEARRAFARTLSALVAEAVQFDAPDRGRRAGLVNRLLSGAERLAGRKHDLSSFYRAELEWKLTDNTDRVPDRLSDAAEHATTRKTRYSALNNLSVWLFDHQQATTALRYAGAAVRVEPELPAARFNSFTWNLSMFGRHAARRYAIDLEQTKRLSELACVRSVDRLEFIVARLGEVLDLSPSRAGEVRCEITSLAVRASISGHEEAVMCSAEAGDRLDGS